MISSHPSDHSAGVPPPPPPPPPTTAASQRPRLGTQEGIMYLRSADSGDFSSSGAEMHSDSILVDGLSRPCRGGNASSAASSNSFHELNPRTSTLNFQGIRYVDDALGEEELSAMILPDDLVTPCQGLLPQTHGANPQTSGNNAPSSNWGDPAGGEFGFLLAHATHPMHKRGIQPSVDSYSVGSNSEEFKPLRQRRETAPSGELQSHFVEIGRPSTGLASDGGDSSLVSGVYSAGTLGAAPGRATSAGPTSVHKKTQYHKTKLCPWHKENKCFMGKDCNYAHTREELKPKPDLSKTKLCPEVNRNRQCDRPGCRFAHDIVELRATSTFYKTRICKYWTKGICPAGSDCRHAHGKEDLRVDPNAPTIAVPRPSSSYAAYASLGNSSGRPTTSQSIHTSSSVSEIDSGEAAAPYDHPLISSRMYEADLPPPPPSARPPLQLTVTSNSGSLGDVLQSIENTKRKDLFVSGAGLGNDCCIGPNASALPSPSFLSTKASSPLPPPDMSSFLNNPQIVESAKELSTNPTDPGIRGNWKNLIAKEVERQWRLKMADTAVATAATSTASTPLAGLSAYYGQDHFDEANILGQELAQKLKALTPITRKPLDLQWIIGGSTVGGSGGNTSGPPTAATIGTDFAGEDSPDRLVNGALQIVSNWCTTTAGEEEDSDDQPQLSVAAPSRL